VQPARALDQSIGELERIDSARSAAQDGREQFVVTESGSAKTFELLARPVVRRNSFQRYTQVSMRRLKALGSRLEDDKLCSGPWALCVALLVSTLFAACAEPPNKEIDQAQGAIDAARAAGAKRYAANEYSAATTALKNANDAVAAGDYRLALNHALESREHAQNAARDAAGTQAKVRADVERTLTETAALIARANARMAAAQRARVPARVLRQPAADIAAANPDLQKAGEAVAADDYLDARSALEGVKGRLEKTLAAIDEAIAAQSNRRRR
jgi:hypothetical protein